MSPCKWFGMGHDKLPQCDACPARRYRQCAKASARCLYGPDETRTTKEPPPREVFSVLASAMEAGLKIPERVRAWWFNENRCHRE